jgi:hypothetical protein
MALVWKESTQQAVQMLDYWRGKTNSAGISTTNRDVKILAMHVLMYIGFGKSYGFRSATCPPGEASTMSYRDSFTILINHVFLAVGVARFPRALLRLPFLPSLWLTMGHALTAIEEQIGVMVESEKLLYRNGAAETANLLSGLVRGNLRAQEKEEAVRNQDGKATLRGLTDMEIFSNIFVTMLAGHETSGNSLVHCILYMAAYPQWQAWVAEEIRAVIDIETDVKQQDYQTVYPRLKRCKAILVRR